MLRLFIALLFPDKIKQDLADLITDLKPRGDGIKWVKADNIHLTLKFLGDTHESNVDSINMALDQTIAGRKLFAIRFSKCGGFPNLKNPRVLWVGLDGAEPAIEMAKEIDKKLASLGIEKDKRPLSPHLTLGRIKRPGNMAGLISYMENLTFDSEDITLNRVALVKSTLTRQGPIYENLKVFNLE
jgi:2'-5' RNA ligase